MSRLGPYLVECACCHKSWHANSTAEMFPRVCECGSNVVVAQRLRAESAGVRGGDARSACGGSAPGDVGEVLMEPLPQNVDYTLNELRSSATFLRQFAGKTANRYVRLINGEQLRELTDAQKRTLVDQVAQLVDMLKGGGS